MADKVSPLTQQDRVVLLGPQEIKLTIDKSHEVALVVLSVCVAIGSVLLILSAGKTIPLPSSKLLSGLVAGSAAFTALSVGLIIGLIFACRETLKLKKLEISYERLQKLREEANSQVEKLKTKLNTSCAYNVKVRESRRRAWNNLWAIIQERNHLRTELQRATTPPIFEP